MELSVTVSGKGGVDLTIRIELRLTRHRKEVKGVDPWRYSFTCNDLGDWAVTKPYGDRAQATVAFNKLFEHVQRGKLVLGVRCSNDSCRGERCHGMHRVNAVDFAQLEQDQLDSIPGIGRERRYRILVEYWLYWRRELKAVAA